MFETRCCNVVLLDVVMLVPVALLADVLLDTLLVSLVDGRDVVLPKVVLLDVAMPASGVPPSDVLPDAQLVQLVDVRDVVLLNVALLDAEVLVPVVLLTDALLAYFSSH